MTATECWNILRGELGSEIYSYVPMKKQGNGRRRNICQKRLSERLDIGPKQKMCSVYKHTGKDKDYDAYNPASTLTIRQPKPNRWFNVGPTATYLVGPTLLCSLDKRWPNINCQPKPNQAPTITQHCPNYHQT